jgi:hypothetical protein
LNVKLTEKVALLRQLEGNLRGLGRPLTKSEVARLIRKELGKSISEAYLSQIESGKRPHMSATSRGTLSEFFKVHPGYLVDDPDGFGSEISSVMVAETDLDTWMRSGALAMAHDASLSQALRVLADHDRTRELMIVMSHIAQVPEVMVSLRALLERLLIENSKSANGIRKEKREEES